jgi:flagellar secretion chaperone FliS
MSMNNPYGKYLETQIMTASPGKLLLMTYDGAIRFARAAQESIRQGNLYEQGQNIQKVQNILLELMASLNPKVDRQLTANLDALYTYMFDRLTHANIHDDTQPLEEVAQILTELRAVWAEADLAARAAVSQDRKAA